MYWIGQELKIRIVPIILTNGLNVVKGTHFNNWRTVGNVEAIAKLFANRDVDELIFLDVNARKNGSVINSDLVSKFSNILTVPFGVGGGIKSVDDADLRLSNGAEKVICGTLAFENLKIIERITNKYGSQAVSVTIDIAEPGHSAFKIDSGSRLTENDALEFAINLENLGVGEIILQCVPLDGMRQGMDYVNIKKFSENLGIPLVASSGAGSLNDFVIAAKCGASAVAAGSVFQFTEITPLMVRDHLRECGFEVRNV